ncbi:hypothetical protein PLICRDRAFT_697180 [Plicaturopsis crispa FD-325 SS-3]|nr:hypothetical protein PLICRDRAFT_697180 [Plicaturopsis crispa FD-325 SS-3]
MDNVPPKPPKRPLPSLLEIREKTFKLLGHRPCLWQIRAVEAILKHDQDVVCISATGSGKTLTFWMPLLFTQGIQVIITPLNLLGNQNVQDLARLGIPAIAIDANTATAENFRDIADLKYRVVVTNIELALKDGNGFGKLWKTSNFASRIISVIWDEAHCISKWGNFRPEYKDAGRLRYLLPPGVRYFITSATLPPLVLNDVLDILQIRKEKAHMIHRSNDRPNVYVVVREMAYPLNSFRDLDFLIPKNWKAGDKPPKFLIFFDNITDSIAAAKHLREMLPPELRGMLKWFNADMSPTFRVDESEGLKQSQIWGLACTDSFGMGIDLSDIEVVIQWRATCDIHLRVAIALFLVEPKYFDAQRAKKAERKAKKDEKGLKKRKAESNSLVASMPSSKRARTTKTPVASTAMRAHQTTPAVAQPAQTTSDAEGHSGVGSTGTEVEHAEDTRAEKNAERRARYSQAAIVKKEPKNGKSADGELEPAIDDMINAGTRPGLHCSRLPAMLYFENDTTVSDHLECDPNTPGGCRRCRVVPSTVCCDLCNPAHFTDFARVDLEKPKQAPNRSRIDRNYTASAHDMALRDDLNEFREEQTITRFGRAHFRNLGPGEIMSDEVLKDIVDFAHHQKIATKEELEKETKWQRVEEYGSKVLQLIARHCTVPPPPPPHSTSASSSHTPLQPRRAVTNNGPPMDHTGAELTPAKAKRVHSCKACGASGHIASNRLCPKNPKNPRVQESSTTTASVPTQRTDENLPPLSAAGSVGSIYEPPPSTTSTAHPEDDDTATPASHTVHTAIALANVSGSTASISRTC